MSKKLSLIFLFVVVVLGFVLRLYKVTEIPPSLNWDEVSINYNAYSILKTSKDEWNQFLPVHFKAYGEYKLPTQVYFSIPAIAIFGLSEIGVRITPVVYGTITILLLYLLAKDLSDKKIIGLLSALFLAISPWHIHLTRASFESSFAVMWVVLGTWLFIKGLKDKRWWLVSTVPFALAIYTYNAARVFVPLFLIAMLLIYRKTFLQNKKFMIYSLVLFTVFMIPLAIFFFSGEATARLSLVSITDDRGFAVRINEARGKLSTTLPEPIPRLVHNKVTHFSYVYTKNYLSHFNPAFLFITGAPHKQHHVQGIGELYAIQAPFVLIGLYYLFTKKHKHRWLIISWILLAFIPVSITIDSIPHALRTLIAAPIYQIITAFGIFAVYEWMKKKNTAFIYFLWTATLILLVGQFYKYLDNYYNVYPKTYSRDWQYGYKEVVGYIKANYDMYDLIVFTRHYGEPHMFTLFFMNWDPANFQNDPKLVRFETFDWVRVLKFDKFYFPDLGDTGTGFEDIRKENNTKTVLFIGKPDDFPEYIPREFSVDFLNGDGAFDIVKQIPTNPR